VERWTAKLGGAAVLLAWCLLAPVVPLGGIA
jgi:hypothetical protein